MTGCGLKVWSGVVVLFLSVTLAGASDWPRFRGINGQGISLDKHVPTTLDADKPTWKVKLPGGGNASPIVCEGRIYLQTASEDGTERAFCCYSLADGKLLWQDKSTGKKARIHKQSSLASGTAACDGKQVYVALWDGDHLVLTAYTVDGKHVWKRDLGEFATQHGAGHSPLVYKDKVIFSNDQDGVSTLMALSTATGDIVWETPRPPSKANYLTPVVVEEPNEPPEIVVAGTPGFGGYNPDTGKELWHWDWIGNGLRTVGSLAYGQGIVVTGSGNGAGNRNAAAVRTGGHGDVTESAKAWDTKESLPYVPTMIVWGEHLFYMNDRGVAGCLVLKSGKRVWEQRVGGNHYASPLLVDGKIYAFSDSGDVYVFEAAANYKLISRSNLGEAILASPAVANDTLIIRGATHLFAFGPKSGETAAVSK